MPPRKQDLANFIKWLTENNISFPYISISPSQNGGLGLFNTTAFQSITNPLATIPASVCLNATIIYNYAHTNPFFHSVLETIFTSHHEYLKTERVTICLFLIFEKFFKHSNDSCTSEETNSCFWCPYINIFPSLNDLMIPLTYPPDLLALLNGTRLHISALAKKSKLEREFTIIQSFCKSIGELTFEMWLWADAMVWSRALSFRSQRSFMAAEGLDVVSNADENDLHLVPLLDFANHSLTPLARWHINPLNSSVLLLPLDNEILSYTIPTEITITYGSKPNQELLFLHGFAIPSNPNRVSFTVPAASFFEEDPNAEKKVSWMQIVKLKPILTLQRDDNTEAGGESYDGWTLESMGVMWLCCLGDEDGLEVNIEGEDTVITIKGEIVTNVVELDRIISTLPLFQVFHLRAVSLLLSALDYHYSELLSVDAENSFKTHKRLALDKGVDPVTIGYIEVYRNEELEVIAWGLERLLKRKEVLLESDIVNAYLENANGDSNEGKDDV